MDVITHRTGDLYPTIYIPASEQAISKKNWRRWYGQTNEKNKPKQTNNQ